MVIGGTTHTSHTLLGDAGYEAPALLDLGSFTALTQHDKICIFGKQFGGSDGVTFMGISVPISNCSG